MGSGYAWNINKTIQFVSKIKKHPVPFCLTSMYNNLQNIMKSVLKVSDGLTVKWIFMQTHFYTWWLPFLKYCNKP